MSFEAQGYRNGDVKKQTEDLINNLGVSEGGATAENQENQTDLLTEINDRLISEDGFIASELLAGIKLNTEPNAELRYLAPPNSSLQTDIFTSGTIGAAHGRFASWMASNPDFRILNIFTLSDSLNGEVGIMVIYTTT